ncbi:tetratricopeptide repeat protein [Nocardioides sp. HDW12B]|uniref:tetratricopeptide repeat protein n=1 Tax=Nocardioides sp. HDW12B TaxID=2714939 RepID=UPI001408A8AC|nr:tetratricopeptide repeat protein [Nocardioides sp. HDW12B]QIK64933.1 tetratricopeptide repeat protein [Nocardioides sp. HDW12B]
MNRTPTYVAVLATALVLSVGGALGLAGGAPTDSGATTGPAATPAVAPAGTSQSLDETITALQDRLRRLPEDDSAWATLALAYVEQARLTGDPSYYPKAEQAVATSLDLRPGGNVAAHSSAAALAAARHDFDEALGEADRALAIAPRDGNALAVRVDALTELGRYAEQERAVRRADRLQPGLPVAARYSYVEELRGDLTGATRVLERSLASASMADRAFLSTQIAELERRRGLLGRAERSLAEARRAGPDYFAAEVSRARLAVAQGDLTVAERRWAGVVRRVPLPEYLLELGEIQLVRGRTAAADQQFSVIRTTTRLFDASGVNTDLETAIFEADHGSPARALRMARAEWSARQSIHVADALAWALHVNGRDAKALELSRRATRLGTQEARLWMHRGLIEAALGRAAEARRHLRRGLAADPGVSPWQAAQARDALQRLDR